MGTSHSVDSVSAANEARNDSKADEEDDPEGIAKDALYEALDKLDQAEIAAILQKYPGLVNFEYEASLGGSPLQIICSKYYSNYMYLNEFKGKFVLTHIIC